MSTLVTQPSFRALGQMQVKWQTFEKPENKRQMYGSQAWVDYHTFVTCDRMASEARKQSMSWMQTDYSKHT